MTKRPTKALISRQNWLDTRVYLSYVEDIRQAKPGTIAVYRGALDLFLQWGCDVPFPTCEVLRPVFPVWLADGRSASYQEKVCRVVRNFLRWAMTRDARYADVDLDSVEALRPAKGAGALHERGVYRIDAVRDLVAEPPVSLTDARERAAIAFMFLSGMRIAAFTTLPLRCVDLAKQTGLVMQYPSLGVRTKNSKAAKTWLLNIPDLLDVVADWDARTRATLSPSGMWYSLLAPDGEHFARDQMPGRHRGSGFNKRLKARCQRLGVTYHSSHALRRGHAVWALGRCATLDDMKAVSQNMMHDSLRTTDALYANLVSDHVACKIEALTEDRVPGGELSVHAMLEALLAKV